MLESSRGDQAGRENPRINSPTSNQFTAGIHSASNSFATWAVTLLTVSSLLNNSATNLLLALPPLQPVHYENLHSYSNSLWTLSLRQPAQNGCSHCCSQLTMDIVTTAARSQWLFSLLQPDHNGCSHCGSQITMASLTASAKSHWLFSMLQPVYCRHYDHGSQITMAVLTAAARLQWLFSLLQPVNSGHYDHGSQITMAVLTAASNPLLGIHASSEQLAVSIHVVAISPHEFMLAATTSISPLRTCLIHTSGNQLCQSTKDMPNSH